MSEILIFRFEATGGPGYFGRFLSRRGIPFRLLKLDQGDAVPTSIDGASALVFMGGGMSANDPLVWIPRVMRLIRMAHERGTPVLGHCLGGQLIARALGGTVRKNPVSEIGWLPVSIVDNGATPSWCKRLPSTIQVFQWHHDTFSLPQGAVHLFESGFCRHQGFQIGNTLGLQFHVEILPEMVRDWAERYLSDEHVVSGSIQSHRAMIDDLERKTRDSFSIADQLYQHWLGPSLA